MSGFKMRKSLETMEEYSVEHVEADIIANANESNYPMPQKVVESINIVLEEFPFNRYPPIKAESLCELIGDDLGVDSSNIHIGNGSSELLQMACYAFGGNGKRIAFPYPSFSMYGVYVNMADSESLPYKLTEAGYIDADAVIEFCEENNPDLLIICNPNNPTGNYNKLEVIEKILANVKCPVLVDEAYMEFASGTSVDPHDLRPLNKLKLVAGSTLAVLHKYNNFICMRTFSKAYG